ncbi:NAD(+)--dinitrogen-reductase ADP-D-ribosyltransferase [Rhodocyclus gracilis]|uniref:NAD(+)--dinitrogen-reductase ADP-D-ribosyltransferase n=1 Tax=Rhodocyclus tenuis TaxID=1066 RepID=A0A6L5JYM8_RHOTE|nr:NAD(+)--dinitrogen-reductase ADP-D-ribosyltransferase [Rhodocyclus gracilis]MQY52176.1 NAD(+)--dinitrogen-reductase ADP-D-ribosyltransferase [Rhodocyclus gracilis]
MPDIKEESEFLSGRDESPEGAEVDNHGAACRADDNRQGAPSLVSAPVASASRAPLPAHSCLPINRCNLPASVLAGLTFQKHPAALEIDGVAVFHRDLFRRLDLLDAAPARAAAFRDYMSVRFCLEQLDEAGLTEAASSRAKANWLRLLRGWSFNADSREGAALKGWVESRFGLLPRFHGERLRDPSSPASMRYQEMRAQALYGANALEAQLDLVYAYCQYEFRRRAEDEAGRRGTASCLLYRGVNRLAEHEVLQSLPGGHQIVWLNSLCSFSRSRERAGEFGDHILCARVPQAKIFVHSALLPGALQGEDECVVIGGAYAVTQSTF